jgi:hypothetical protein
MNTAVTELDKTIKIRNLILGLLFDLIGMLSFSIPLLGDFSDIIWAPISTLLLFGMYKGNLGKVTGVFSFVEEIFPVTDIIPTFTLTWIYKYIIQKNEKVQ